MRIIILAVAAILVLATAQDCKDLHDSCELWAAAGDCDNKNSDFMNQTCPKSCDKCVHPRLMELGSERVILEVAVPGNDQVQAMELGFYPNAAPVTVAHVINLVREGCYDTNLIFRVDKGFLAQVQLIHPSTVRKPLSETCLRESKKNLPPEFTAIPHQRGILSMGRREHNPNPGGSSFMMLLGDAPQLDQQYTVFGKVLKGDNVLKQMELVETRKRGIDVMPIKRVEITRAWVVVVDPEEVEEL